MKDKNQFGEYTQFVKSHWSKEELGNLKVVTKFLQALKATDFDKLLSAYGNHPYMQHNLGMENGIEGVIKQCRQIIKHFPEFSIDTKHVYLDGEFVIIHSHMIAKPIHSGNDSKGFNVIDIWKVIDEKIVEHWDSIQPIDFGGRLFSLLTGGNVKNGNSRF